MSTRSTAQVPVPDELNLDLAFDGESLDRLLEVEVCTYTSRSSKSIIWTSRLRFMYVNPYIQIPDNLQLASLYLVRPPSQILPNFDVFVNSEQDSRAKSFNSSMPEVFEENGGGTSAGMRYYMNTRSSMKSIALFLTDHLLHSFLCR